MTARTMIAICRSCASEIYGTRKPTPDYAEAVARLLMGTAATESHLVYRRQLGFGMDSDRGAWGLWQTEQHAVADSVKYLLANLAVRERAAMWLYGEDRHDMGGILGAETGCLLRMIHDDDRLACLFARLHYIRFRPAVPRHLRGQAEYWKRYYNTVDGKGTPEKYINDWRRIILPELEN